MPKKYNYTKKTGRPDKYSEELALEICNRIANGESLLKISKDPKVPHRDTIHRWLLDDNKVIKSIDPETQEEEVVKFHDKYEEAVNIRTENMFDELEEIADNDGEVQRDRLRVDTRKWYLSKVMPKKYGDKLGLEHSGEDGQPIAIDITNTLTKIYGEESD